MFRESQERTYFIAGFANMHLLISSDSIIHSSRIASTSRWIWRLSRGCQQYRDLCSKSGSIRTALTTRISRTNKCYCTASKLADFGVLSEFPILVLLPGGRPRFLAGASVIHAGGLPTPRPLPLTNRSRLQIASSICSRSRRNSASIFATSMQFPPFDLTMAGRNSD